MAAAERPDSDPLSRLRVGRVHGSRRLGLSPRSARGLIADRRVAPDPHDAGAGREQGSILSAVQPSAGVPERGVGIDGVIEQGLRSFCQPRSRGFPAERVIGPAFTPVFGVGWYGVGPFTGLLGVWLQPLSGSGSSQDTKKPRERGWRMHWSSLTRRKRRAYYSLTRESPVNGAVRQVPLDRISVERSGLL